MARQTAWFAWVTLLLVSSAGAADFSSLDDALRIAAREGRYKDVAGLIDRGADVNSSSPYGETALMYAARFNQILAARVLIQHGARVGDRDTVGRTALHYAAVNCSQHIAEAIIRSGVDVNMKDFDGHTALILSAQNGCRNTSLALLSVPGISVEARDDSGRSALDYAQPESQAEVGGSYTDVVNAVRARLGLDLVPVLAPVKQK